MNFAENGAKTVAGDQAKGGEAMRNFVCLLAAVSLAACATATPSDQSSVGKTRILVGDPSAIQPTPASSAVGLADNGSQAPEPKRVYWFLAGR